MLLFLGDSSLDHLGRKNIIENIPYPKLLLVMEFLVAIETKLDPEQSSYSLSYLPVLHSEYLESELAWAVVIH